MTNYTKNILLSSVFIFIMMILSAGLTYLFRIILAKNLSVEEYGLFFAGVSLIGLLSFVRNLGTRPSLIRFSAKFNSKRDYKRLKGTISWIFLFNFLVSIVIFSGILLSSDVLQSHYFHVNNMPDIIFIFSWIFLLMFTEVLFTGLLSGLKRMYLFGASEPLRMALFIGFTVFLFSQDMGVKAPLYGYLLSYVTLNLLYLIMFIFMLFPDFFSTKSSMPKKTLRQIARYTLLCSFSVIGAQIFLYFDTSMLSAMQGVRAVGMYQAAVPIATLLLYISIAITKVLLPFVTELWEKKEKEKISHAIRLLYSYGMIIIIPFVLAVMVFSEPIITLFFGSKYITAAPALQVLSLGMVFYSVALYNRQVLTAIEKPETLVKIFGIGALMNILLNLILIPSLGFTGAAIATSLSFLFAFIYSIWTLRKTIPIELSYARWGKIGLISAVTGLLMFSLKGLFPFHILISMGAVSLAGFFLYGLMVWLFKVMDYKETKEILRATLSKA